MSSDILEVNVDLNMADLFTCELSKLKEADIRSFLGLELPLEHRPTENVRLDYKEKETGDLGSDIAAMANSLGGLILIGVAGDKKQQNIPIAMDGIELTEDFKARKTNQVLTTVSPRPSFEMEAISLKSNARYIVVVRVEPGNYPPYEFHGGSPKIPIRTNDSNPQASLRQIEDLIARRGSLSRSLESTFGELSGMDGFYASYQNAQGNYSREDSYQRILVAPRTRERLRLDSKFEQRFESTLRAALPKDWELTDYRRRGSYYQVERRLTGANRIHMVWRIWSSGALGLVANLTRRGHPGEWLGEHIADFIFLFEIAVEFFEEHKIFGPFAMEHILSCPGVSFLPLFPPPDGLGSYDKVSGISLGLERSEGLPASSAMSEELQWKDLKNPVELISTVYFSHLREIFGARIDFDRLRAATQDLYEHAKHRV